MARTELTVDFNEEADAEEYRQNLAFEKKRKLTIEDRIGVAIMGTKIEVVTLKSSSK